MNHLFNQYLGSIDPNRISSIRITGEQLLADGWELDSFDLEGGTRGCYFTKNGAVVALSAPVRRWWHALLAG